LISAIFDNDVVAHSWSITSSDRFKSHDSQAALTTKWENYVEPKWGQQRKDYSNGSTAIRQTEMADPDLRCVWPGTPSWFEAVDDTLNDYFENCYKSTTP
jgi:hypothetical protein